MGPWQADAAFPRSTASRDARNQVHRVSRVTSVIGMVRIVALPGGALGQYSRLLATGTGGQARRQGAADKQHLGLNRVDVEMKQEITEEGRPAAKG